MAGTEGTQRPDSLIDRDDGRKYWSSIDADDNGMLGGYPQVSREDLLGSRAFLAKLGVGLRNGRRRVNRALEGGAGIGRITRGLLLPIADTVDLIEPIAKFTDALREAPGVGSVHNVGLEEWTPPEGVQYDLVWTQWCVGHLTDEQLVDYLKLCGTVLEPKKGFIVIKENLSSGDDEFDDIDSSVTRYYVLRRLEEWKIQVHDADAKSRQDSTFLEIFKRANMRIVKMEVQRRLNTHDANVALLPVKMYALRPHGIKADPES